jgi:hypothetical protein
VNTQTPVGGPLTWTAWTPHGWTPPVPDDGRSAPWFWLSNCGRFLIVRRPWSDQEPELFLYALRRLDGPVSHLNPATAGRFITTAPDLQTAHYDAEREVCSEQFRPVAKYAVGSSVAGCLVLLSIPWWGLPPDLQPTAALVLAVVVGLVAILGSVVVAARTRSRLLANSTPVEVLDA